MPPKKRIEATVFIVDCNNNVEERLQILYNIYTLKYFAQTKGATRDFQKIILYNHRGLKSKHIVNDWQFYSLELLKNITTETQNLSDEYKPHNFLYILNGALECLEEEIILQEYIKRIVFITDLSSKMDFDNKTDTKIDFIKHEIITNDIWLYVLGLQIKLPKLFNQVEIFKLNKIEPLGEISPDQKSNYEILRRFDRNTVFVDKKHGTDVFFSHKIEPKTPFNWYVKINIGPDLEIPVMVHRTTRNHEIIKFFPCPLKEGQGVGGVKAWFDVNTHEKIPNSDVVKGYKFQGKFIEISNEQFKSFKKIETQKCLTIFGFANADEVPVNLYIMADTICSIKADNRGAQSTTDRRFSLFVKSLRVKNSVALAYRVYNNGNSRKFFCIFPCPEHKNDRHLLMGQFPYQHEFHEGFFRGKVEESEYTSDTYKSMEKFLNIFTPEKNNVELYPLAPSMQVSKSRERMAQYLICKAMGTDPGDPPELKIHPAIEEEAEKHIEDLLKEVLIN